MVTVGFTVAQLRNVFDRGLELCSAVSYNNSCFYNTVHNGHPNTYKRQSIDALQSLQLLSKNSKLSVPCGGKDIFLFIYFVFFFLFNTNITFLFP